MGLGSPTVELHGNRRKNAHHIHQHLCPEPGNIPLLISSFNDNMITETKAPNKTRSRQNRAPLHSLHLLHGKAQETVSINSTIKHILHVQTLLAAILLVELNPSGFVLPHNHGIELFFAEHSRIGKTEKLLA